MRKNESAPGKPGLAPSALLHLAALLLSLSGPLVYGQVSAGPGVTVTRDDSGKKSDKKKGSRKDAKKKKTKRSKLSPEAALVRKHLKDYLQPSEIKFLKGGRVRLLFSFSEKSEHHEKVFIPRIGSGIKAPLRWSQEGEEAFVGSESGIRISDRGFAMLDCWFLDDVDARIEVLQHINYTPRMYVALTFNNEKGRGIGANYGGQCAMFSRGRLAKRGSGKPLLIPFNVKAKLGMVIKDGFVEARKGDSSRARARMKYSPKTYPFGRVGFSWGGSMSATVTSLEVTGKLDIPKMAKLLARKLNLD